MDVVARRAGTAGCEEGLALLVALRRRVAREPDEAGADGEPCDDVEGGEEWRWRVVGLFWKHGEIAGECADFQITALVSRWPGGLYTIFLDLRAELMK